MIERRQFLRSTGIVAAAASVAGCLGGTSGNSPSDQGDETVKAESSGFWDVDTNVYEERMGQEVEVTELSVFRTQESVGIRFVAANESGGVLTDVTAQTQLLTAEDEVVDTFETTMEAESIDDLAKNEKWHGDMFFEGVDVDRFEKDVAAVRFWVTAQAEPK